MFVLRRSLRRRHIALVSLLFLLPVDTTAAQAPRLTPTSTMLTMPRGAHSAALQPAALPRLYGWSATFEHQQDVGFVDGDALRLATPLPFGLGIGIAFEHIRPSGFSSIGALHVAGGLELRPGLSAGIGLRFLGSEDPRFGGAVLLDASVLWTPANLLAFSLGAQDINGALNVTGANAASTWPSSFFGNVALRPFGDSRWTLEAGATLDTEGAIGAQVFSGMALPHIGELFVRGQAHRLDGDPDFSVTTGLRVAFETAGQRGSVLGGAHLRPEEGQSHGWFAGAELQEHREPGLPRPKRVLEIRMSGLGARGILGALLTLDRARRDPEIAGVVLYMRGSSIGTAYAQELRAAIANLRGSGRPVVCHLEDASEQELFACSRATHAFFDPAGGARVMGVSSFPLFYGDALEALGVRADFVRIGKYKSAPEQYTRSGSTQPAKEQRHALYGDVYHQRLSGFAKDWSSSKEQIARLIDRGPFTTKDLAERNLIRGAADAFDFGEALRGAFGGEFERTYYLPTPSYDSWSTPDRIGVVIIDGDIVDGNNTDIPLLEIHQSGGHTIVDSLDRLANDSSVRAIVVRIDSPGGSALASDQIWRAMIRARKKKPVIASMGAVAASGGYYAAAGADEIYAMPATVTGSIGIFFGKVDFVQLASKIGVGIEEVRFGKHAGADSFYRPFTVEERLLLEDKIAQWYDLFLDRIIAGGTKLSRERVDSLGRGRVWSGQRALELGLVHKQGGFNDALRRAEALAGLDEGAPIFALPGRPEGLIDYILAEIGVSVSSGAKARLSDGSASLPVHAVLGDAVALLLQTREGSAMARLPWAIRQLP